MINLTCREVLIYVPIRLNITWKLQICWEVIMPLMKMINVIDYDANPQMAVKHVGDKVYYYDDGLVNWGGLFTQVEYKAGIISSFVNVTASVSGFKKKDYFGNLESDWKYKPGFTVKTGANYNLTNTAMYLLI